MLLVCVQVGGVLLSVAIAVYEGRVLVQERALDKVLPAETIESGSTNKSDDSNEVPRLRKLLEEEKKKSSKILADFNAYKKRK